MTAGPTFGTLLLDLPIRFVADTDECIEWPGARDRAGYGVFTRNGKSVRAHRVFWEKAHGIPVPPGYVVMHLCDNPPCVNPHHLDAGTVTENVRDCHAKGRANTRRGESHGMSKLTLAQVKTIRERYTGRRGQQAELAQEFGVHFATISGIVNRKRWAGVG